MQSANSPTGITNGIYRVMGSIASVDSISAADATRTAGTYTNVSYSAQGSGTGATFNITINGSGAASITITSSGKGYVVNNTITVADSQLGGGGAPSLTFDVASISDEFKFRRSGSTVGTNLDGDPLIVGSGVGSKRYIRVPKDNDSDNVTGGQPDEQVSNAPVNQIWRIEQFTLQNTSPGGGAGSNSSNTAGGSGGNGELIGVQDRKVWNPTDPYGMVFIPQGSFMMGPSDQDVPFGNSSLARKVSFSISFG